MERESLDQMMLERLTEHREFARKQMERSKRDPKYKTSKEFSTQVFNESETTGFALNWLAEGEPKEFFSAIGYDWEALFRGSPIQQLVLRMQVMDDLLDGFEPPPSSDSDFEYDVFLSHATEDKEKFVRPLFNELTELGTRAWFDESVEPGNSLRAEIDKALVQSRFGAIVISPAFIGKPWPGWELDGLVAREMEGTKVIIPIWYNVKKEDVLKYSPPLASKLALIGNTKNLVPLAIKLNALVTKRVWRPEDDR